MWESLERELIRRQVSGMIMMARKFHAQDDVIIEYVLSEIPCVDASYIKDLLKLTPQDLSRLNYNKPTPVRL